MKGAKLATFLFLISTCMAFGQDNTGDLRAGILYGPNWACMITAPDRWYLDNQSWSSRGIFAVFCPENTSLTDKTKFPPVLIYFNSEKLNDSSDSELQSYVNWDRGNYEKSSDFSVTERKLSLVDAKTYYCYNYDSISHNQYETTVYLRFKDSAHLIVLVSHDKALRDKSIEDLVTAINSMKFMDKTDQN